MTMLSSDNGTSTYISTVVLTFVSPVSAFERYLNSYNTAAAVVQSAQC